MLKRDTGLKAFRKCVSDTQPSEVFNKINGPLVRNNLHVVRSARQPPCDIEKVKVKHPLSVTDLMAQMQIEFVEVFAPRRGDF